MKQDDSKILWFWASRIVGTIAIVTVATAAGCPQYRVYSARLAGEAIQAQSQGARQSLVSQAQAEKDAAQLRADAVKIMGAAAKEFPEYRQQEFIGAFAEALKEGNIQQIIYVPTEAGIPITEAGRLGTKK